VHSICALSAKLEKFTWKQRKQRHALDLHLLLFVFVFLPVLPFSVSVSVCRLSRFLLPCSLVQLEAKLVLGDEDDGWQCFFLCFFSFLCCSRPPLCTGFVVVVLLLLVHSGGFAVADADDSVEGLFHQHCFFSSCCFLCFFSFAIPFLLLSFFSLFLLSFFPLLSLFLLSFSLLLLLGPSSGFYSQRMHALWQAYGNGWWALWWWGNQPRDMPLIAAPPLPFLPQKPLLENSEQCAVILNATAPFQFQNDISDLVIGCFYYFVIKPPRKSCNWILWF